MNEVQEGLRQIEDSTTSAQKILQSEWKNERFDLGLKAKSLAEILDASRGFRDRLNCVSYFVQSDKESYSIIRVSPLDFIPKNRCIKVVSFSFDEEIKLMRCKYSCFNKKINDIVNAYCKSHCLDSFGAPDRLN